MTIPSTLESLSPTIGSNVPAEGDETSMQATNDGLRAAYGFVRQTVTAGSTIASANTITPASTGSSFDLSGTTTVTAIGSTNSWNGRLVAFYHTGAHTFTHSASLNCLSGQDAVFASGDISMWRQRSSGVWDQVIDTRAPAAFNATSSATLTAAGTYTTFTENTDLGSDFNPTTGIFTAPRAGIYSFSATLTMDATAVGSTTVFEATIQKNSATNLGILRTTLPAATPHRMSLTTGPVSLALGDTIQLELLTISGGTSPSTSAYLFSGSLLF